MLENISYTRSKNRFSCSLSAVIEVLFFESSYTRCVVLASTNTTSQMVLKLNSLPQTCFCSGKNKNKEINHRAVIRSGTRPKFIQGLTSANTSDLAWHVVIESQKTLNCWKNVVDIKEKNKLRKTCIQNHLRNTAKLKIINLLTGQCIDCMYIYTLNEIEIEAEPINNSLDKYFL